MSKRKYRRGVISIKKQIHLHKHHKLESAWVEGNTELARYYEKEVQRLEEQLVKHTRPKGRGVFLSTLGNRPLAPSSSMEWASGDFRRAQKEKKLLPRKKRMRG